MRSITFNGITITTTTPSLHLINDIFYDTGEVLIFEYNINEVLNIHNGDFNYNTKKKLYTPFTTYGSNYRRNGLF